MTETDNTAGTAAGNTEGLPPEAAALINDAMDGAGPEPGAEPELSPEEQAKQQFEAEAAAAMAPMIVGLLADNVQRMHPALDGAYDQPTRDAVAGALAPVLAKYGGWPAWLEPWKEEIGLAIVLGGVAFSSISAVRAYQPPKEGEGDGVEA